MPGSYGEHDLQARYGTSARARSFYDHQVLDRLSEHMQAFVRRMDMVFIATADASGEADCSFRAGPPGFIGVLDDRTLAYPEYRGNGVMGTTPTKGASQRLRNSVMCCSVGKYTATACSVGVRPSPAAAP